jgi:hypothetical protein
LAVGIRHFTIFAEAGEIALKLKDQAAVRHYLPEAVSLYATGSEDAQFVLTEILGRNAQRQKKRNASAKVLLHRKNLAILVWLLTLALFLPLLDQEIVLRGRVTGPQGHGLPMLRFSSSATIPGQRVGYWTRRFLGRMAISKLEQRPPAGLGISGLMPKGFRELIVSGAHPSENFEITLRMRQISSRVETIKLPLT